MLTKKEFNQHKNKVGRVENITDDVIDYIIQNEDYVLIFDYDLSKEHILKLEQNGFEVNWIDCRSYDLPDSYEIKRK